MILQGDCLDVLKTLDGESVDCVMTSPPYWNLRDYGIEGQLGLEPTFQDYITKLCDIFDEVKRVLKKEGTCFVNIGDTYGGGSGGGNTKSNKQISNTGSLVARESAGFDKCLLQIPSRFAIEMCNRGWILRNEIIWHKPNCMPSSVKDRFTVDFEKLFFFTKSKKYYFETQYEAAVRPFDTQTFGGNKGRNYNPEKGDPNYRGGNEQWGRTITGNENRNKRSVWRITTKPYKEAHFATYPEALCETPIKAGCPVGGIVLDPFFGAGTTGLVAKKQGRNFVGFELNPEYIKIAEKRLRQEVLF